MGREGVPQLGRGIRKGPLAPRGVGPRDLEEKVTHHRSRGTHAPPPWDSKTCEVRCVKHLGLVKHREGTDSSSVLEAVQQPLRGSYCLMLLLLLLLLLPSPLWPSWRGLLLLLLRPKMRGRWLLWL